MSQSSANFMFNPDAWRIRLTIKRPRLSGIRRLLHDERAERNRRFIFELFRDAFDTSGDTGIGAAAPAIVHLPAELLEPCPDNVRARKIDGQWRDVLEST